MPLSVALGRGPAAWVDVCGGATSRVEDVVPIGFATRTRCRRSSRSRPSWVRRSVPSRRTRSQTEGPAAVGERVAADLAARAGRFWMHLDVDILGEDEFPATDYLMPDGLDMDELVALMRPLAGVARRSSASRSAATTRRRIPVTSTGVRWSTRSARPSRLSFRTAPAPPRSLGMSGMPSRAPGGADGERGGHDRVADGCREFGAQREAGCEHAVEAVAGAGRVDHRDVRRADRLLRSVGPVDHRTLGTAGLDDDDTRRDRAERSDARAHWG